MFRLLLAGGVGLVCFLILEGGVRLFAPQPVSWLAIYRGAERLPFYTLEADAHGLVDTGETRWEVWTDSRGHRFDGEHPVGEGPAVLWLGDSYLFGHGVDYPECWVGLLQHRLGNALAHVNTGVAGHGPTQYRLTLEDLLPTMPDPRLVCAAVFLGNDIHDTIWEKNLPMATGILDDYGGLKSWLKKNLHSYRLFTRVLHARSGRQTPQQAAFEDLQTPAHWEQPHLIEAMRRFSAELAAMQRLCTERGIPFVVLVIPTPAVIEMVRAHGAAASEAVADERGALFRLLAVLEAQGQRVVDATETLVAAADREPLFFRYDGHLTPCGHRLVAELLLREVPELGG